MSKEYYNDLALKAISDEVAFVEFYEYFSHVCTTSFLLA